MSARQTEGGGGVTQRDFFFFLFPILINLCNDPVVSLNRGGGRTRSWLRGDLQSGGGHGMWCNYY